jgi:Flp pilus assembly protein TadD
MQRMKRPRRALADYHRALSFAPEDRDVLMAVAELYRSMNQPHRALATLNSLAETYPPGEEPPRLLHLQGMAYVAVGRFEDAVEAYRLAAVRSEGDVDLLCHLAQAEALAGRPEQAAAAARQALALDPRHEPSRQLLDRLQVARQPGPLQR